MLNWIRRLGFAAVIFSVAFSAAAEVRQAHVAGSFYPADEQELRSLIGSMLEAQPAATLSEKPRIIISPHAGYIYSGPIAASAFHQIKGKHYDGVVVVGFTHQFPFAGSSVDSRTAYQTPLGTVTIDENAVALLRHYRPHPVGFNEAAHASNEHSLEVMLPFLQTVLGDFKLVPILMGEASLDAADQLAEALAALANSGDYLFVFSSDLSHYHPKEKAETIDERTVNAILSETPGAVERLFDAGLLEACGRGPILTSLLLSKKLGYLNPVLLRYANSGDTAGDPSRVVGYAAIAMTPRHESSAALLPQEAGIALAAAARQTLEQELLKQQPANPVDLKQFPQLQEAHGLFVTLRKNGQLRGCIGRITTNEPLAHTLPTVALDAALRDHRFPAVSGEELKTIAIEVSVLTSPTPLQTLQDLVPGRDGVVLESQGHSGVFLPTVWDETGWTRVEFLSELASQKAGLPSDAWKQATLFTFRDQVFEEPSEPAAASSL